MHASDLTAQRYGKFSFTRYFAVRWGRKLFPQGGFAAIEVVVAAGNIKTVQVINDNGTVLYFAIACNGVACKPASRAVRLWGLERKLVAAIKRCPYGEDFLAIFICP